MGIIYKITCSITGLVYIGRTTSTIKRRWYHHTDYARRGGKSKLCQAINEYGSGNFEIEILEECNNLNERERYWIAYYNSYHNGMNHTETGRQGGNKGITRSVEANAKQSRAMTGRIMPEEIRLKISAAMSNRTLSETHKVNLRKPKSPEARANMLAAQRKRRQIENGK